MRKIIVLISLNLISFLLYSQDKVFTLTAFYDQLLIGHPIVKQANLLSEYGKQEIRLARGNFDPKLTSNYDEKQFKSVEYFRTWISEVKIPTQIGLDFKTGYERNRGAFLDPERTVPTAGLAYAGVSVPILQGMLFDQRRAALREAQYFREIAEADKIKSINKIILQATKDYWGWFLAYHQLRINQNGFDLARVRYEAVVERIIQGDLAGIDSVEAKIIVQQREIALKESQVNLSNARLILSNHLWDIESNPIELQPEATPTQNINEVDIKMGLEELLTFAKQNHPEIVKLNFKIKQLEIGRKLAIEMLKPVVNLNYNFLGQTPLFDENNTGAFFQNNYKYGIDFSFPLYLRKERAKVQQANIKLQQTQFERTQVNRELLNQINAIYNDLKNIENLLVLQESMVNNNRILLVGEQERFALGESSLFLVNTRETSFLSAEIKFIELQFKYAKAKAELLWAAGRGVQ
ncbi:MAG: TolC family protein [Thermoflexibacter sp.]|jgi:outer membrane protein TolC|nr:TolC family protein [Thermoflexibacter sp.]